MTLIGFRIEITGSSITKDDLKSIKLKYNKSVKNIRFLKIKTNSQIVGKNIDEMLMAKTIDNKKFWDTCSFSLMTNIKEKSEAKRIVQIINVLGNDRIIRERISLFVNKQSMLNNLPDLNPLVDGMLELEKFIPNILKVGYYYAPEIIYK